MFTLYFAVFVCSFHTSFALIVSAIFLFFLFFAVCTAVLVSHIIILIIKSLELVEMIARQRNISKERKTEREQFYRAAGGGQIS